MIRSIQGKVSLVEEKSIVVDVGGVGYELFITPFTRQGLHIHDTVYFYTSHIVREDASHLYGFIRKEDCDFFELLLTLSGIGPRSALSILSLASRDDIIDAIKRNDSNYLVKISGIGKKTAQKIVSGLQDISSDGNTYDQYSGEIFSALESLGYSTHDIRKIIPSLDTSQDIQKQLRHALQLLGK